MLCWGKWDCFGGNDASVPVFGLTIPLVVVAAAPTPPPPPPPLPPRSAVEEEVGLLRRSPPRDGLRSAIRRVFITAEVMEGEGLLCRPSVQE